MTKIVKNVSGSPYPINDVGYTLATGENYTIPATDYLLWASSSNAVTGIGAASLLINDGSFDLSISNGTDLIKGIFPTTIKTEAIEGINARELQGRMRASQNTIVFASTFDISDMAGVMKKKEVGGGTVTHNVARSSMELKTGTASGDKAIYQTTYIHYIPGQTFTFGLTGVIGSSEQNRVKRFGSFDDNSGVFFQHSDAEGLSLNIRSGISGTSDQKVLHASFNGDPFTSFDKTKKYLFQYEYLWQGAGPVKFYVYADSERKLLHTFNNSGLHTSSYMKTGTLPIRYEVENFGACLLSNEVFEMVCIQSSSEGNSDLSVQTCATTKDTTTQVNTSSYKPILSLRLKSAFARAVFSPKKIKFLASTQDDIVFRVVKNATLTGASFSSVGANSAVEEDFSATSFTGGEVIDFDLAEKGGSTSSFEKLASVLQSDVDGNVDTLTLVGKSLTNNANVFAGIKWEEIF